MTRISRRKLAHHAADRLQRGDKVQVVFDELAAYLLESGRKSEATLVVRDIEAALLEYGIVVVTAVSARALSAEAKRDIEAFVRTSYPHVQQVALRESIDPSVIGGVALHFADKSLDTTVKTKLEKLVTA
jgi:F0F1-type ATP synthase delta subunit